MTAHRCSAMSAQARGRSSRARPSTRWEPRQRARPPRGGRLRRGRGCGRVRDARLHLRGGGHSRQGARLPRRLPRPHRRLRGPVREQGGPDHRDLPALRRGGAVGRRGLRRRAPHGAWRGPRPGAHLHAREQQDRGRASLRGRGRGRPSDRRLVRRDRPPRRAPGSPSGRSDPRHPGDPALHPFLRADGRPRLEVRLRARGWPGGARDRRGAVLPPPAAGRPARPHRLADLRAGALRGGDRGAGRARGRRMGVPHPQRRRRPGDRLHVGRSAALDRQLRRGQGRAACSGCSTRCRES